MRASMRRVQQTAAQHSVKPVSTGSAWSPFRHTAFTVLWLATVVSNIGNWMQNAAASWLMTSLNPDPLPVSLVQAASAFPMFLFSLPAGALADIVDRRRLLLLVQIVVTVLVTIFGSLVWAERVTPYVLLAFIFLSGVAAILIAPAWQAIVAELVPKEEISPAIALNSTGFNAARVIGPAVAGLTIAAFGMAAPFWINASSNLAVIAALVWWRRAEAVKPPMPAERFVGAIRDGLRYARHNQHLRATL